MFKIIQYHSIKNKENAKKYLKISISHQKVYRVFGRLLSVIQAKANLVTAVIAEQFGRIFKDFGQMLPHETDKKKFLITNLSLKPKMLSDLISLQRFYII